MKKTPVNYKKELLTVKWRIKRHRIITRDGNKCTVCGSKKNLQVHHTYYYKDRRSPYKYPDSALLTVCDNCHYNFHIQCEVEIRDASGKKKKKQIQVSTGKQKKKKHKFKSLAEQQRKEGIRVKKKNGEVVVIGVAGR